MGKQKKEEMKLVSNEKLKRKYLLKNSAYMKTRAEVMCDAMCKYISFIIGHTFA